MRGRHFAAGHGLGVLLFCLIAALVIGLVVFAAVRLATRRPGPGAAAIPPYGPAPVAAPYGRDPAVEQARLRYARGELGRDDYLRVVSDLGGGASAEPPPTAAI